MEHGGNIEYRDRDGGGAEFVVDVPVVGTQTENGTSNRLPHNRDVPF